jgi:hypothetical protein
MFLTSDSRRGTDVHRAAAAVYGTILVLAVIVGISSDPDVALGTVLGGVAITVPVFWAAHVYADGIASRIVQPEARWRDLARRFMAQESPLVESAVLPAVPLVLGLMGVLSREIALWAAIGVGLAELFACGVAVGRVLHRSRLALLLSGAGSASLGVVLVILKVIVGH